MNETYRILVIDDDSAIRDSCLQILSRKGCEVVLSGNGGTGIGLIDRMPFDVVLLDMKLPDMNGPEILDAIMKRRPETAVVIITGYPNVDVAVNVMKSGAFDYLPKPFTPNVLRTTVSKALEKRKKDLGTVAVANVEDSPQGVDVIIGISPIIQSLRALIGKAGMSDCSVLITGETGTGKELTARALHYCSRRRNNNFITVDSGGLADTLIESELFGHVKGAFTGAYTDRIGRFEMAHKGTLFFDEISNMTSHVQSKLLRVLQEQEFARVGCSRNIGVNVRIIAATNSDLAQDVEDAIFRRDLFYRLNVISIHMPPLRERRMDISVLADYFLRLFRRRKENGMPERISSSGMKAMLDYHWPGNIRELENVMERSVALSDDIEVDPFQSVSSFQAPRGPSVGGFSSADTVKHLEDVEKEYIEKILKQYDFNKTRTASALGIDRKTLRVKILKYGIPTIEKV